MDYTEYAANMDLGQVFLDVMGSVNERGFAFIGPELERWQEFGQVILASSLQLPVEQQGGFEMEGESKSMKHNNKDQNKISSSQYQDADDDVYMDDEADVNRPPYPSHYLNDCDDVDERGVEERVGSIRYSESGDIEVDLDGTFFNSFTLADRVRKS